MDLERTIKEIIKNESVLYVISLDGGFNPRYDSRGEIRDTQLSEEARELLSKRKTYSQVVWDEELNKNVYNVYVPFIGDVSSLDSQNGSQDDSKSYGVSSIFCFALAMDNVEDATKNIIKQGIILGIVVALAALVFLYISIRRDVTVPIGKLNLLVDKISNLDLTEDKAYHELGKNKTEVGYIANNINRMRENLNSIISDINRGSQKLYSFSEDISKNANETSISVEEVAKAVEELANGAYEQAKESSKGYESVSQLAEK
ncbi:MAG: methyl-accepting chemotaxis protein, partial [Tissierellia bacterium]|nr:methyl-accepting chemotaxis protein [Tissierellia bacterium]